jgi:hypothetical protein
MIFFEVLFFEVLYYFLRYYWKIWCDSKVVCYLGI